VSNADRLSQSVDTLSAIGRKLLKLGAETAYVKLVVDGDGDAAARDMLEHLTPKDLVDGPIASPDDAAAVMSGLWLRHDWLDQSHRISQGIDTPTGSLWHAIMHRREGDFSNSKYWYHRADGHPTYKTLAARASDVINPYPADKSVFRLTAHGWDPSAFVDLVAQVYDHPDDPRHRLCVSLQELEWQTLFEHCTRAASGR
jgi:hypothetical protein